MESLDLHKQLKHLYSPSAKKVEVVGEIYLGNPMRADPAKLKTILRHPVRQK